MNSYPGEANHGGRKSPSPLALLQHTSAHVRGVLSPALALRRVQLEKRRGTSLGEAGIHDVFDALLQSRLELLVHGRPVHQHLQSHEWCIANICVATLKCYIVCVMTKLFSQMQAAVPFRWNGSGRTRRTCRGSARTFCAPAPAQNNGSGTCNVFIRIFNVRVQNGDWMSRKIR